MRSIEVHLIETDDDIDTALASGLLEIADLDATECSACSELVGHVRDRFIPFTLNLDEADIPWFTCVTCAQPILEPEITSAATSHDALFELDDDLDDFRLFD